MSVSKRAIKSLLQTNEDLVTLFKRASKQKSESAESEEDQLVDLLNSLESYTETLTEEMLVASKLGSVLGKISKSKAVSEGVSKQASRLVSSWKTKVTSERAEKKEQARVEKSSKEPKKSSDVDGIPEPPKNNSEYRSRLTSQNKELYKDPPQNPILNITVSDVKAKGPSRAVNGDFTFVGFSTFKPNRSPEEVLRGGRLGGRTSVLSFLRLRI
ncbi:hypothetical protein TL16_g03856 [Triparma laevis f. inornata]|uniref:TFIIS N-terminal domain-containing protein n=1 Tax=Triparma laevis f. inornata TaxID=1714386 RepID=A0A9W7A5Z0_9STRA|nr:hypothetical protein TL16_g03856 [Triparma laevis f. inornata]